MLKLAVFICAISALALAGPNQTESVPLLSPDTVDQALFSRNDQAAEQMIAYLGRINTPENSKTLSDLSTRLQGRFMSAQYRLLPLARKHALLRFFASHQASADLFLFVLNNESDASLAKDAAEAFDKASLINRVHRSWMSRAVSMPGQVLTKDEIPVRAALASSLGRVGSGVTEETERQSIKDTLVLAIRGGSPEIALAAADGFFSMDPSGFELRNLLHDCVLSGSPASAKAALIFAGRKHLVLNQQWEPDIRACLDDVDAPLRLAAASALLTFSFQDESGYQTLAKLVEAFDTPLETRAQAVTLLRQAPPKLEAMVRQSLEHCLLLEEEDVPLSFRSEVARLLAIELQAPSADTLRVILQAIEEGKSTLPLHVQNEVLNSHVELVGNDAAACDIAEWFLSSESYPARLFAESFLKEKEASNVSTQPLKGCPKPVPASFDLERWPPVNAASNSSLRSDWIYRYMWSSLIPILI